ncbi:MAG TPA: hypothetical protein DCS67_08060 [Clostridiales bacterium UBA8960]|nr:hypothetical protein [Clostridiales bacterium UBA8960]
MNINCGVILDLIPLVKDGVASHESTLLVNEHVLGCESCKAEFETFKSIQMDEQPLRDRKIIFDIKRSIYITQVVILTLGAIFGIALSSSMGMFYNFIIMPVIGGVACMSFKEKWIFAPAIILILTYLWQTVLGIAEYGISGTSLTMGLYYSVVYAVLVVFGAIIAMLLRFAFERGEAYEKNEK